MGERDDNQATARGRTFPDLPRPPKTVFVRRGEPASDRGDAARVTLPGSKYLTLRYLLNAALAEGESVVRYPALSEDTEALSRALVALGARIGWEREGSQWRTVVQGCGGRPTTPPGGELAMGNAGAALRLLLGVGALLPQVRYTTDHPESLGERPNDDLLAALRSLGIATEAREPGGRLPITLRGGPPAGGEVTVSGARSSQYLSALLYLAPLLPLGLTISVRDELRSAPLVWATLRALRMAGISVEASSDLRRFVTPGGQTFRAREYVIPGDGPSAAALLAAAVALGTPLRLDRLETDTPDVRATLDAFAALGVSLAVSKTEPGVVALAVRQRARGAVIDGDACIDSVPALAALACLGEGTTRFENVATLRLKESDRIGDLCAELSRAGCAIEPGAESITVHGRPEGVAGGVVVAAHDDHRLAQALAIVASQSERGLTITGADAVAKSYPSFFDDLAALGAEIRGV